MASTATQRDCYILGVGLTRFQKPRGLVDYTSLGLEACVKALLDAGVTYDSVSLAVACYVYGDSTAGQRVLYQLGLTGIPVYNVNNNCSTGATGLNLARDMIRSGQAKCALVVGFEKMAPGSLAAVWGDRANPTGRFAALMAETRGITEAPTPAQFFGNAGREYMENYGAVPSDFAEIARINHQHSAANPYSQFRTVYTLAQIESSPMVHAPLTKLQCCPTSDGAAAAVLCSADFLNSLPDPQAAWAKAVRIVGMRLATDGPSVFSRSAIDLVGFGMTSSAARAALAEAGLLKSQDVDNDEEFRKAARKCAVVELHDCFSANELITLDALGLADAGKAHLLVREGGITYPRLRGDRAVVNPSGGLISKGHPLGATGIAQAAELVWHLRGWATNRAVGSDGGGRVRYALQHNLGLGGAVVVAVYERADGKSAPTTEEVGGDDGVAKVSGVGYNPATEARGFTPEQARSVMSSTKSSAWASGDDERRRLESRI